MSPLNEGQQKAAEGFFEFLFSDESQMIISGAGGVGKTFLMGHLIDVVMPRYHNACQLMGIKSNYHSVMMTATTNKAAEVLGQATRRPTKTIHSFMNLRVQENFDTGKVQLRKNKNWTVHENIILFIDECSMIDTPLYRLLQEGTSNCKIIYVGDHSQLAPVMEPISPIYKLNLPFFELTQPMRNSESPGLIEVCSQLRETVATGVFKPIKVVPGVVDLLPSDEMEQEIQSHFMEATNQDRILAYTNNRTIQFNDYIRSMRGYPQHLSVGERVINCSAAEIMSKTIPVEMEFEITRVDEQTSFVTIKPGVELEVRLMDLKGIHYTFHDVNIPANRDHYLSLMKYYANQQDWVTYFNLKNKFLDLRPRDATTVHKSQGSTHETVFVDLDDLSTCKNPTVAARLLYVAFTRAKKRVVLHGKLAPRFGGVVT